MMKIGNRQSAIGSRGLSALTSNQRYALLALRRFHRAGFNSVSANAWRGKAREIAGRTVSFQPEALFRRGLVAHLQQGGYGLTDAGEAALRVTSANPIQAHVDG